jgi:hypothetical protein
VAPLGASVVCENEHDAATGRFKQPSVTGLPNPADGAIEMVKVAICPVRMLALPGWLERAKPPNCSVITAEEVMAKFASPL